MGLPTADTELVLRRRLLKLRKVPVPSIGRDLTRGFLASITYAASFEHSSSPVCQLTTRLAIQAILRTTIVRYCEEVLGCIFWQGH